MQSCRQLHNLPAHNMTLATQQRYSRAADKAAIGLASCVRRWAANLPGLI